MGESQHDGSVHGSSEGAREREFYKYYEPYRHNHADFNVGQPWSSSEAIFVSFAQLCVHRLDCRRVIISFFDRKSQYLLAEATKTQGLPDDRSHADQNDPDNLWLGSCIRSRPALPCEWTMQQATDGPPSEGDVHIIPDVNDSPMKHSYPNLPAGPCFYAGMGIKSANGYVIGTLSAFDDGGTRHNLDKDQRSFLKNMAVIIQSSLENIRGREEHRRAARMVLGLGNFIEHKDGLHDWYTDVESGKQHQKRPDKVEGKIKHEQNVQEDLQVQESNTRQGSDQDEGGQTKTLHEQGDLRPQPSDLSEVGEEAQHSPPASLHDSGEKNMQPETTSNAQASPLCEGRTSTVVKELETTQQGDNNGNDQESALADSLLSTNVKKTFSRASNIIVEAIEVDSTVFFDASTGTFASALDEYQDLSDSEHNSSSISGSTSQTHCAILGSATSHDYPEHATEKPVIHQRFLQQLMRRHPNGKVFSLEDSLTSSQDSQPFAKDANLEDYHETLYPPEPALRDPQQRAARLRMRESEMRTLQKIFPNVRSLAFMPLWDNQRQRWFAAGFAMTRSPIRILHMDSEASFMRAFGNSVMSEVARLDAAMEDKAKSDLLSSISHELRSPLHGILGSSECLRESELNPSQEELVRTMEICGETLLDVIDNLLDYSKLNNFAKASRGATGRRNLRALPNSKTTPDQGMISLDIDLDLAAVTEEAMDSVFAGFDFSLASTSKDSPRTNVSNHNASDNVVLILDLAKLEHSSWRLRAQAGAWRRVVMNLCGNALKYTSKGFVCVSLSAESEKDERTHVVLKVTDSGKGMSPKYLNDQLFKPFAQEDPLRPGVGLGLSIVRKIVQEMDGNISVESVLGKGTEIKVDVCLDASPPSSVPEGPTNHVENFEGLTVGILAFADDYSINEEPTFQGRLDCSISRPYFDGMLSKLLKDWLRVDVTVSNKPATLRSVDILIADEKLLPQFEPILLRNEVASEPTGDVAFLRNVPILILCHTATSAQYHLRRFPGQANSQMVNFISQPFGPRKLSRALAQTMYRRGSGDNQPGNLEVKTQSSRRSSFDPTPRQNSQPGPALSIPMPKAEDHVERPDLPGSVGTGPDTGAIKVLHTHPIESGSLSRVSSHDPRQQLENSKEERAAVPTSAPAYRGKLNLLLVDDNAINLQILERYMKSKKHSFCTASDGVQALEAFVRTIPSKAATKYVPKDELEVQILSQAAQGSGNPYGAFDVILMDISMPVMDGLEACVRIRTFERACGLKKTTIVALTGLASSSAQHEAFRSGVDLFLTKPVRLKELTGILAARSEELKQAQ